MIFRWLSPGSRGSPPKIVRYHFLPARASSVWAKKRVDHLILMRMRRMGIAVLIAIIAGEVACISGNVKNLYFGFIPGGNKVAVGQPVCGLLARIVANIALLSEFAIIRVGGAGIEDLAASYAMSEFRLDYVGLLMKEIDQQPIRFIVQRRQNVMSG
jgi:hypothetical protein